MDSHRQGWFDYLARHPGFGTDYYGRDGEPISFAAFAALFEDPDYKVVQQDRLTYRDPDDVLVSTVWLGLDHGFGASDAPLIFETLVFAPDDFPLQDHMERYFTEQEAQAGHLDILDRVRALLEISSPS